MNRNDPEYDGLFAGAEGLWGAVLLNIVEDARDPRSPEHDSAMRIVEKQDGCFPIMAEALGIDSGELKERILRAMRKRGRGL